MKNIIAILLIININIFYGDWGYLEKYDMIVGTPQNHHNLIDEFDQIIVYYHTRTCKYCKISDRFIHDLALKYKEGENRIPFVNVSCDDYIHFCEQEGIIYYPYIKIFVKGHSRRFKDKVNEKNITKFVNSVIMNIPKEIGFGESQKIIKNENKLLTYYYNDKTNTNRFKIFDLLCKFEENIDFYYIKDEEFGNKYNLNKGDIITFKNNQDFIIYKKNQINNFDEIEKYYFKIINPIFYVISNGSLKNILENFSRFYFLFTLESNTKEIEEFSKFAEKNQQDSKFVLITETNPFKEEIKKIKDFFMLKNDNNTYLRTLYPSIDENHLKYNFEGNIEISVLETYNKNLNNGNIKAYYKNEDLSENNILESFEILNRENYNKIIKIKNRDKVVLVHDGLENKYSKRLFNMLKKLKNKFKKDKTMKFYLFDINKNEHEHIHQVKFPAIFIYSRVNFNFPLIVGKYVKEQDLYFKIKERHFKVADLKQFRISDL